MKRLDSIEREYEQAIDRACQRGRDDVAFDLSIGLRQYRELYKELR